MITPGYYNLGHIFVVLVILSISNNNTVLSAVITEIWEHDGITTTKSHEQFRQITVSGPGVPKRFESTAPIHGDFFHGMVIVVDLFF